MKHLTTADRAACCSTGPALYWAQGRMAVFAGDTRVGPRRWRGQIMFFGKLRELIK